MSEPLLAFALIVCCILAADGVAAFPRKLRDVIEIESTTPNPAREAQVQAEDLAELLRDEIDATKRGDLLAAARYDEEQETARA